MNNLFRDFSDDNKLCNSLLHFIHDTIPNDPKNKKLSKMLEDTYRRQQKLLLVIKLLFILFLLIIFNYFLFYFYFY